jgi:uncharacterized protein YjiS (DUF1127 family)
MLNYRDCNDTMHGHSTVSTADSSWRQWLRKGLALLVADTRSLFGLLVIWQKRSRQRFELATLDERTLKDLGISRAERDWEVAKPFWRV